MILLLKIIAWLLWGLPMPVALWVGRLFGRLTWHVIRLRRKVILDALQQAFPDKNRKEHARIAAAMYRQLGMTVIECLRVAHHPPDQLERYVRWENEKYLKQTIDQGRGALVLMAHTGNWELFGWSACSKGYEATAVVKKFKDSAFQQYWTGTRQRTGLKLLSSQEPSAMRTCLKRIRAGEAVAMIMDQYRPVLKGVQVEFFGRMANTTPGLALMAAATQVPVVPVFTLRQPDHTHLIKVLSPLDPPPDRSETSILTATQEYTRIIEQIVREHPEQWIWMHKRWKKTPPDTARPAADS